MTSRNGYGPSLVKMAHIRVGSIAIEYLVTLDLDVRGYAGKWAQAKELALRHPRLESLGWPYWRVVRQLFVELGGLPVCWEDDYGRPLPDDHPDRAPWNPWPWWVDLVRRGEGREILAGPAPREWPSSDSVPKVADVDYTV